MATKILFIGNSYTSCNDLPGMLQAISLAAGKNVEAAHVTSGGQTLEGHWYNSETLNVLEGTEWDFVVLQEQSTRPVEKPEMMMSAAKRLKGRAGKAKVVLYHTWAHQHIPEMQDALNDTYFNAARELGCKVAPVGLAWRKALRGDPDLVLHTDDGSHPNTLGTYLTACVFYATIFRVSPVDLTNAIKKEEGVSVVIDESMAKFLQMVAWGIVKDFDLSKVCC